MARDQLFTDLNEGLGDIVAASLTITAERLQIVDFGDPGLTNISQLIVTGPSAPVLTRLEDPCIKEIGQTEVGMINEIAYDDEYTGPALDPEEGARLARVIGEKSILFMANHGISTVGVTVAEAYDRLYYVERAAQVQIYAMWTGQKLKQLPAPVVAKTKRDIGGGSRYDPPPAQRHFDALKRLLDRKEPDYAT